MQIQAALRLFSRKYEYAQAELSYDNTSFLLSTRTIGRIVRAWERQSMM